MLNVKELKMNSKIILLILIGLFALFLACKQEVKEKNGLVEPKKELEQVVLETDQEEKRTNSKKEWEEDPTFMSKFLKEVEKIACTNPEESASRCATFHQAGIKSDYLQKRKTFVGFPYQTAFDWSEASKLPNFESYWSDKCGYYDEKNDVEVRYNCPNIEGGMRVWLDSLAQENVFVLSFMHEYTYQQEIGQTFQQRFILEASNELDFNNEDHRAFYWVYTLSLSEILHANTRLKRSIFEKKALKK